MAAVTEAHHITLEGVGADQIDETAGVIRGVKLIGNVSRNGRDYPDSVIRDGIEHYAGADVYLDHPKNPGDSRSVTEKIGWIENPTSVTGKGGFGDFHFNPAHPATEQLLWFAKNKPSKIGFSHNASLRMGQKLNGRDQIAAIIGVRSVDLVADAATTASLFEHVDNPSESDEMKIEDLTLEQIKSERSDIFEAIAKEATESADQTTELEELRAKVTAMEATEATRKMETAITEALESAGLDVKDEKQCSPAFMKVLRAAEETDQAELIADRAELLKATEDKVGFTPAKTTQDPDTKPTSKNFFEACCSR